MFEITNSDLIRFVWYCDRIVKEKSRFLAKIADFMRDFEFYIIKKFV